MADKKRMRLTDARIARLRPQAREYTVWDSIAVSLGVRVRPSGGASFVILRNTRGRSSRVSLGSTASKGVEDARRQCREIMAFAGIERAAEATGTTPLFRDFANGSWTDAHFPRYKPSTLKAARFLLSSRLIPAFGSTPLDRITRTQVLRWFDAYSRTAPGAANSALRLLNQILNFALAHGHVDTNPARGVKKNRRTVLTRFLSHEEIGRLHRVLEVHDRKEQSSRQQADIIRLLLLTGCRKSEILGLRWSEVDRCTLILADSKTGPRSVTLNARARRVIERQVQGQSAFVFPSPRDASRPRGPELALWDRVRREAGIEDVRLHDLRHTFASHAVMNGVPVPVVARLLGHTNVKTTLRYAHLADKEIEAAAERVGAAMAQMIALED